MKNKSLMIIVFVGVLVFTALLFSVYKIVTKDATVFYTNGYVSISDAEKSEKIYFTQGTSYKRGYGKEVIFKDKDNVKQEIGKFNFVFYEDKSINFLNDGVLLDLNEVNESFVPYYNIKSNYLIKYNSGKYVIDSTQKDVIVDNFIGRINDGKYLVAGNNLKLKLSSSKDFISGYYFELNFIDGKTVKIDNDTLNVETISDEAYIMVGDKIKIDLSKQVIFYEDESKINLSEIIINHDENIDIPYEEPDDGGDGEGDGGGSSGGTPTPPAPTPDYEVETVIEYKNIPYVELLNSVVNSHKINVEFNVIDKNNLITGLVTVRLVDLQSGKTVDKTYNNYSSTIDFIADSLRSDADYLVTIFASYIRNGAIFTNHTMFQRTFSTRDLGVELEKDYVASDELAYNVKISENATFTSATLNLYDAKGNLVEKYDFINKGQDASVVFTGLNSNTKYTAKLENITYGNVTYTGGSAATLENKTLKYNPFKDGTLVTSPVAIVNKKDYVVKFDLGVITDNDLAIKGVKFEIYDKETDEIVKTIKKDTLSPIEVAIKDEIEAHKTYYYKAIISLNDNEKNIDYETLPSNDFNISAKISPTMQFTSTSVTSNTLNGYFTITDVDNAIDVEQSIYVEYTNSLGDLMKQSLEYSACPNEESATTKCAVLELTELNSDEIYTINLMAYVDLKDETIAPGHMQIGAIKLNTEEADIVLTQMSATELNEIDAFEKIFEVNIKFLLDALTDESVRDNMSGFDIMLYEGSNAAGLFLGTIHVGEETDIVEEFFNNFKTLTLADFGLTLDDLIRLHITEGGQISQKYTIRLANGKSGTEFIEFKPYSFTFEINEALLGLSTNDAQITVTPILNNERSEFKDPNLNGDTIIGLQVMPNFGNKKYATEIDFVIKDITTSEEVTITHSEKLDLQEGSIIPAYDFIFKDNTEFFKRGRIYQIEYTIQLDLNGDGETDLIYPFASEDMNTPQPVVSDPIEVPKQTPSMVLFPWISDSDSISYKYHVTDIDNALGENYKVKYSILEYEHEATKATCANSAGIKTYVSKYDCVELAGLNDKDQYTVYLNATLLETPNALVTRVNINTFTFEGTKDLSKVRYDLELNEDGNSKYNNLFSLKITEPFDDLDEAEKLITEEIKNRVAYYSIELMIDGTNRKIVIDNINGSKRTSNPISTNMVSYYEGTKKVTSGNLQRVAYVDKCENEKGTCVYVDYSKLYNNKTFKENFKQFRNQKLNVLLNAYYDNGNIAYQTETGGKYAFQVKGPVGIKIPNNNYYLSVFGRTLDAVAFSPSALSAVYLNLASGGGFVDDAVEDNNTSGGKIYLINTIYSNLSPTQNQNYIAPNYVVTSNGVEITLGYGASQITVPIVAKKLVSTTLNGTGNFTFDRVIPSINVSSGLKTLNGIKLSLGLSGINEDDITKENGKKYVYLEVYDKETDKLIKTVKVDKDSLTTQKGTVINGKYTILKDDDYKVDITSITSTSGEVKKYSYDYKTGVITFDEDVKNNTEITISYRLVLDDLNVNSTYYLKAYMQMDNKKTYLVEMTSSTYETFKHEFSTKKPEDVKVSNPKLDVLSETDYATRYLVTSYSLEDIIGINNLKYEICNEDKSICVDVSKYKVCDGGFNNYDGSCFVNANWYDASIYHDISKLNFEFNTSYNVVIKAEVEELNGVKNDYEILNRKLDLRALKNPTLNVIKNAGFKDGKNPYLSFDVSFTDNDRIIENGEYTAYLATGTDRVKVPGTEMIIKITEDGLDKTSTITYENLNVDSAYYLMIDYKTYANNAGQEPNNIYSVPYLIYTLGDNGISVGRIEYTALSNTSLLKFGYATNMTRDYIMGDDGTPVPDPNQEAYVAGIVYHITRTSGDNLFAIDGQLIFDENNQIEHKNDSSSSETVGDNYYQITLHNTVYPVGAGYSILFQFYLGGNIASGLNSEEACINNGISNYWNAKTNECYILDDTKYDAYTMFESGKGV